MVERDHAGHLKGVEKMAKAKSFTFTKAEIEKFKAKEAKMTPEQKRAASKAQVLANSAANSLKKKGKA